MIATTPNHQRVIAAISSPVWEWPDPTIIFQFFFFFITFSVMIYYCTESKSWKAGHFITDSEFLIDTMTQWPNHMPSMAKGIQNDRSILAVQRGTVSQTQFMSERDMLSFFFSFFFKSIINFIEFTCSFTERQNFFFLVA
jgi:hypothetical protein